MKFSFNELSGFLLGQATVHATLGGSWVIGNFTTDYPSRQSLAYHLVAVSYDMQENIAGLQPKTKLSVKYQMINFLKSSSFLSTCLQNVPIGNDLLA